MFELHQVNDTDHAREEDDEMEEEGEDMVSDIISHVHVRKCYCTC